MGNDNDDVLHKEGDNDLHNEGNNDFGNEGDNALHNEGNNNNIHIDATPSYTSRFANKKNERSPKIDT